MIARYSLPEITRIWRDENKYALMLKVEILAVQAQVKLGNVPKSVVESIKKNAKFNIDNIKRIEEKTHHDVVAFITDVSKYIGKNARYFHVGLASSDVLDTALSVQCVEAADILLKRLKELTGIVYRKARE
ncbi:MAG TPA: adenylosuccinate lyase, partial [Candidatus Omnitrophica bacterium]|nr:adenylosuccinate lyase [Candidatus Omnitrophota bacterium]